MVYSKAEYEKIINGSPLFETDKEKDTALYKRERYSLLCLITDYYRLHIYKNKKLEEYSLTLMETATECIKYYRKEKGCFLNLLNHNMKRNFAILKAKEAADKYRQGITIGEKNEKMIRMIVAYAKRRNLDINDPAVRQNIAAVSDVSVEKIEELIEINKNATAKSSTVTNENGDEVELFDLRQDSSETPDKEVIDNCILRERLDDIETAFISAQNRQKRLLSMLLTAKLLDEFRDVGILRDRAFYDRKAVEIFEDTGKPPTAKQIAESCGVSEQSASRTYKNFIEKIKR